MVERSCVRRIVKLLGLDKSRSHRRISETSSHSAVRYPEARGFSADVVAAWLAIAAVLFNFLLAFVNANGMAITSSMVILSEGLILGLAHLIIIRNYRRAFAPWYGLIWIASAIAIARGCWLPAPDPKSLRDVLIIPTFICLGMLCGAGRVKTVFIAAHVVVCAVVVIEFMQPDVYSALLNVNAYYIATRGSDESSFWNQDTNAFVSATRPGERYFLPFLNVGRMSSVFVEPVSLGNYAIIATIFACVMKSRLTRIELFFFGISTALLIVACDGRLAGATSAVIVVSSLVVRYVRGLSWLYLPVGVIGAFATYALVPSVAEEDNLLGRVSYTAIAFSSMGLGDVLGIPSAGKLFSDSGVAYLVQTQSIFGVAILWLSPVFLLKSHSKEQAQVKNGTLLYLAFTMIISNSFLTIKTGALLWLLVGALQFGALDRSATRNVYFSRPAARET